MMASDTLYLKIDRNILVRKPQVHLQDIAEMECTNEAILRQLKQKKIYTFTFSGEKNQKKQYDMQVFSVLSIIQQIHNDYPQLEIQNIGEPDFIIQCKMVQEKKWLENIKTVVLCIVIFFGAAFTIMAFNNDIGINDVFARLYQQVMGKSSDGVTELEICYALGMPVGIMVFYNHIGRKKVTHDPTPIQVEMRKYEQDVDNTFIQTVSREGDSINVD